MSAVAFELDETLVSMHLAEPSIDSAAGDASRKFHGDAGIAVATLVVTNVVALEKRYRAGGGDAAGVHELLSGWRSLLSDEPANEPVRAAP